jgi:hypothetical protein
MPSGADLADELHHQHLGSGFLEHAIRLLTASLAPNHAARRVQRFCGDAANLKGAFG